MEPLGLAFGRGERSLSETGGGTEDFEEYFRSERCIKLETYRRSGKPVSSPVWFVILNGALMIRTHSDSWKVKRMKANSHARVAPCTFSGKLKGPWFDVEASPANMGEQRETERLMAERYGVQKWLTDLSARLAGKRYVVYALRPALAPS